MANVLLTGAAGAIGMDLAFSLNQAKINVFATEADRDNFFLVSKSCKYYKTIRSGIFKFNSNNLVSSFEY